MPPTRRTTYIAGVFSTILTAVQRRWHAAAFIALALISADTLFLLAHRAMGGLDGWMGWGRVPSQFYQASVLLHSALGYALAALLVIFIALHVPAMLRRLRRRWILAATGLIVVGSYGFLTYSGTYFFLHSKTAGNQSLYWAHMGVGALFLLLYVGHRLFARGAFPSRPVGGLAAAAFAVALLMIAGEVAGLTRTAKGHDEILASHAASPVASPGPAAKFRPATGVDPSAPFFPSPVSFASGAGQINTDAIIGVSDPGLAEEVRAEVLRNGYARMRRIGAEGCARCHADIVSQWEKSAHRFSSFNNPFYFPSLDLLRKDDSPPNVFIAAHLESHGFTNVRSGQIKSQWCAGCHDPALLFQGKMRTEIDRGDVKAQAGLTCLACHQIKDVPRHTGSGNYVWDDEFHDSYLFGERNGALMTQIHDLYLKANPEQHKADMLKPFFRTSEFCGTCHKVSLEPPLNEYHFVRGQDEFDNWHNSGVPHNAARTFYEPKTTSECQTCHMPAEKAVLGDVAAKNGVVKSHRFIAVNTALPFMRGDQDTIARANAYLKGKLRVSFAALRVGDEVGLTTEQPRASLEVGPGGSPELNVVVRNLGVGHTFPGGTNDSNQGWIEISAQDEKGRPILAAGRIDQDGRLPDNTRIYNAVFIDRSGNRISKRNAQDIAALVYAAVIPPSSSDLVRFHIPLEAIPADAGKVKVTARLLWRKFNRDLVEFARAAEPEAFRDVGPDLPIMEIAAATAELSIERTDHGTTLTLAPDSDVPQAQRFTLTHDYGVGLLLQGDTVIGRKVLQDLVARTPECANCLRTLARLYLADRDYKAARDALTEHEKRWPGDAQAAFLWAGVLRGEGADDQALKALERVLERYPQDREALRLTEEITYRSGSFQATLDTTARMLAIDPEDATAHYYAMLAKRALGDIPGSKIEQDAYQYYQRDESAQQMTLRFRQQDPASNFASQTIRVYDLR